MINYPNGKQVKVEKVIEYGKRGMSLEDDINDTNRYYLEFDRAAIYKKPTPIRITKVEYKSRSTAKITEAFFQTPSTTDYNGIYKSLYIDFEAKETQSKTALVAKMIHPHQLAHLERVIRYGGIGFMIIRFNLLDETYFVFASKIINYLKETTRKSIPHQWFVENGILIPYNYAVKVDYLKVIDQYILEAK